MREQLIHYIDLLFAGAPGAGEIKQEIMQNTLDRYDDLINQGKSPEAAYRLAISGIGDIQEILGGDEETPRPPVASVAAEPQPKVWKTVLRAIAIALYIMCPIPLFILENEIGLCGLLTLVAVATVLMVITGKDKPEDQQSPAYSPKQELHKGVGSVVWAIGVCAYFIVSFLTGAWYITWVIFPLTACVQGLINACLDLKEAK